MQRAAAEYTVVAVHEALVQREPGGRTDLTRAGSLAPPEIRERFEGRLFTLQELEQRGVRIAGGRAVYTAGGSDWLLELSLDFGG